MISVMTAYQKSEMRRFIGFLVQSSLQGLKKSDKIVKLFDRKQFPEVSRHEGGLLRNRFLDVILGHRKSLALSGHEGDAHFILGLFDAGDELLVIRHNEIRLQTPHPINAPVRSRVNV